MATLVLAAAGSAVGGAIGGTVLGIGAATIGQAAGAIAGSFIDQAILGQGSKAVETGRARSLRIQSSTEGTPIPVTYGRIRVAGQVIWSTRYLETIREETQGGKATGGQRVREFSYSISLAIGLCEGPISRVGRVWADGRLLDTSLLTMRVHRGDEEQLPDPKIEAVEGPDNAPAYRGLAYVVFEDLQVGAFGNRIPQFNFEVYRSALSPDVPPDPEVFGEPLTELITGVALSPGSGEHALDPLPQRYGEGPVQSYANVHTAEGRPDMLVALDQLEADLPACDQVSLVVSWFGDDLRCGRCRVEPRVEIAGRASTPDPWEVSGLTTGSARLVSVDAEGRPNYGGTPSDRSVIRAIRELNARGKRVMIWPFLLMDVPAQNELANPYTGEAPQPPFPWRGRITLEAAPGRPGSTDQTAAAEAEVSAFFGSAVASSFSASDMRVSYTGPAGDWTWRRFVLHLAWLAKLAGGVDAFCVGSELVGLTTIRSARTVYPAVAQLRTLAAEVRKILPEAKISYGADWTEYWGHQPNDGSGDRIFHLDPLWADPAVDFVGIDDYTSLADWRHQPSHPDAEAGAPSPYALPYLSGNVEGGENYDWFYAGEAEREAQVRTPIADTAHGEHWVFRPKDIRGWWSNPHHDRIGGVRQASPTGWVPQSKPVWLTETGCPAVDLGANRPNLFYDPKSSESALPTGSRGARDDEMQRRFLQAKLSYWKNPEVNPVSSVYGGRMLPTDRVYVWTWDLRPWPDFPIRESVWSDGPNHRLGHWVTGRVSASGLAEVVAAICVRSGFLRYDVSRLYGTVYGYVLEDTGSARQALQPLMTAYGFDAYESGGRIVFRMRSGVPDRLIDRTRVVLGGEPGVEVERVRGTGGETADAVRATFLQSESDFRAGASEAIRPAGTMRRIAETSLPLALPTSVADGIVERWLAEGDRARDVVSLVLPPSELGIEPGDVVAFSSADDAACWRIERLIHAGSIEVSGTRVDPALYQPRPGRERRAESVLAPPAGPLDAVLLDLPLADGAGNDALPWLAASARPWTGTASLHLRELDGGFRQLAEIRRPSVTGVLAAPLPPGLPGRWQRVETFVTVNIEGLFSAAPLAVLNGANRMAVEVLPGAWEILQFRDAELVGPGTYRLSHLIRGERGTETLAAEGAPPRSRVVLLDGSQVPVPMSLDELGVPRTYRLVAGRFAPDHESGIDRVHAAAGIGLRPFSPAHLRVAGRAGEDLVVTWIRRTRVGGDGWFVGDVPLGEEVERYRITVRVGGVVRRSAETSSPDFVYTAAMQAADGVEAPFAINVAQLSLLFGAGTERTVTVHV